MSTSVVSHKLPTCLSIHLFNGRRPTTRKRDPMLTFICTYTDTVAGLLEANAKRQNTHIDVEGTGVEFEKLRLHE